MKLGEREPLGDTRMEQPLQIVPGCFPPEVRFLIHLSDRSGER